MIPEIDANIPKVNPGGTFSSSAYGRKRNNSFSARVVNCENSDEVKKDVNDGMVNVKNKVQDVKPDLLDIADNTRFNVAKTDADLLVENGLVTNSNNDNNENNNND